MTNNIGQRALRVEYDRIQRIPMYVSMLNVFIVCVSCVV